MTWDQISGVVDRLLLIAGTYAVARGWISQSDMMQLVAGLLAIAGVVWGMYINRPKAILQAAANIPNPASPTGKTVIVTTPELAAATPGESNIMSSNTNKVVSQ